MERRIVIDLEMCGIPKNIQRRVGLKREIIQLGAVILEDGIVRARYSEYALSYWKMASSVADTRSMSCPGMAM